MTVEKKRTKGDVYKLYVMPPGDRVPLVRLAHHPYGIRSPGREIELAEAWRDRDELARMIGEMVIRNSPILSAWVQGE
jgi:hypothetical protein